MNTSRKLGLAAVVSLALALFGCGSQQAPHQPASTPTTEAATPSTTTVPAEVGTAATTMPAGASAQSANLTEKERRQLAKEYDAYRVKYHAEMATFAGMTSDAEKADDGPITKLLSGDRKITPADVDTIVNDPTSTDAEDTNAQGDAMFAAMFGSVFTSHGHDPMQFIAEAKQLSVDTRAALAN